MTNVKKLLKTLVFLCLTVVLVSSFFVTPAEARNRTGSHRVGGTNSHGKGSHYVGGHFADQIEQLISADVKIFGMPTCHNFEMTKPLKCQESLP